MQLEESSIKKHSKDVGLALAAATCTLLGCAAAADTGDPGTWGIDTAILYYGEDNGRVQAVEPVISATRYFNNEKSLNLKLVIDTLTGASPSGATPSDEIQTYTRPSGKGSYEVVAGESPLDDTFHDSRTALSASWNATFNQDWKYSTALYGSVEHDYKSLGLSGTLSRYLNQKNTQVNFGLSFSSDSINPEGGLPVGLSRQALAPMTDFAAQFDASREGDSDTKTIADIVLGFSQVINKRTIMQFNYAFSHSSGYLTDPYKILSVIDDAAGASYGKNALDQNDLAQFIYEKRPDSRLKHALFWQAKTMLGNDNVLDGSYRFMTDDWGIQSHTIDLKYRWPLSTSYIEPHLRFYTQSEADFYQRYIVASEYTGGLTNTEFASADYRLGKLSGITFGVKYGHKLASNHEITVRLEYYMQSTSAEEGIGALAEQNLNVDTNALLFTLGYSI